MDITTISLGLIVIFVLYYLFGHRTYSLPPGPKGYPFVGNTFDINCPGRPFYIYLAELAKKYGDLFTMNIGFGRPTKIILLSNADTIHEALVNDPNKFASRPDIWSFRMFSENKDIIGGHPDDPLWKMQRRLTSSGLRNFLTGVRLDRKVHDAVEKVVNLFDKLKQKPIDVKKPINLMVYNFICSMAFNAQYEFDDKDFDHLQDIVGSLDELFAAGILEDIFPIAQYCPIKTPHTKKMLAFIEQLLKFIGKHVDEHLSRYKKGNVDDLIDYLIEAREKAKTSEDAQLAAKFSDTYILQAVQDVFFAGVDTTSYTLYWLIYFLCRYPEVQKRVQVEIDSVAGGRMTKLSDKAEMVYCEAVLYETLRICPVAPLSVFHSSSVGDTMLLGYDVPQTAQLWPNTWACHHDEREWTNPDEFIPERFIHKDGKLIAKPKAFLPFSAGKRACIGENIAKHELFTMYTCLAQKYNFRFENENLAQESIKFVDNYFLCAPEPFKVILSDRI